MIKKDICTRNTKGELHGYCEFYHSNNGELHYKGNFVNGKRDGDWEFYFTNGLLGYKGNFVNGQQHGYWEFYLTDGELGSKGYYNMGKKVDYEVLIESVTSEMFPIY